MPPQNGRLFFLFFVSFPAPGGFRNELVLDVSQFDFLLENEARNTHKTRSTLTTEYGATKP
jgi:hypothetical protein